MENKENNCVSNNSAPAYNRILELEIKAKQAHIQELKDMIKTQQDSIQNAKINQKTLLANFDREKSTLQSQIQNSKQTITMYKSKLLSEAFCIKRKLPILEAIRAKPATPALVKAKAQQTIEKINSNLKEMDDLLAMPEIEQLKSKLELQHQKLAGMQI